MHSQPHSHCHQLQVTVSRLTPARDEYSGLQLHTPPLLLLTGPCLPSPPSLLSTSLLITSTLSASAITQCPFDLIAMLFAGLILLIHPSRQPHFLWLGVILIHRRRLIQHLHSLELHPNHNTTMPDTAVLTTTTDLPPSDDAVAAFDLPFNFTFYGEQYTSVEVSTNGNIQFQSTSIAWVDSIFPINLSTPAQQVPIIAMYYVDLNPDLAYMQQVGVVGPVGNRQAIIRYNQVPVCPFDQDATHNDTANDTTYIDSQPSVTCDVILYELDSHIDIRYYEVDPTPWPVDVGVQGLGVSDWTAAVDHESMTQSVVGWLSNSTLTFMPVCLEYQVVSPPGGGRSTGGTVSTATTVAATSSASTATTTTTMSTGGMVATSVSAQPGGTQVNAAKSITGDVSLLVLAVLIALQLIW